MPKAKGTTGGSKEATVPSEGQQGPVTGPACQYSYKHNSGWSVCGRPATALLDTGETQLATCATHQEPLRDKLARMHKPVQHTIPLPPKDSARATQEPIHTTPPTTPVTEAKQRGKPRQTRDTTAPHREAQRARPVETPHPVPEAPPALLRSPLQFWVAIRQLGTSLEADFETFSPTQTGALAFAQDIDRQSTPQYLKDHPVVGIALADLTLSGFQPLAGGGQPSQPLRQVPPPSTTAAKTPRAGKKPKATAPSPAAAPQPPEAPEAPEAPKPTPSKASSPEKGIKAKFLAKQPLAGLQTIAQKFWGMDATAAQNATQGQLIQYILDCEFTKAS